MTRDTSTLDGIGDLLSLLNDPLIAIQYVLRNASTETYIITKAKATNSFTFSIHHNEYAKYPESHYTATLLQTYDDPPEEVGFDAFSTTLALSVEPSMHCQDASKY